MSFLSILRVWRHELAAQRARPVGSRKRTLASRKRRLLVELLEERVPTGAFFNGFGLGALHTLPLGFGLLGHGAARPAGHATSSVLPNGLNESALEVSIAPRLLPTSTGSSSVDSSVSPSKPVSGNNTNGAAADDGPAFDGSASGAPSGALQPPTVPHGGPENTIVPSVVGAAPSSTSGATASGVPSSSGSSTDAVLFQMVSAAAAGASRPSSTGTNSRGHGGIVPASVPPPTVNDPTKPAKFGTGGSPPPPTKPSAASSSGLHPFGSPATGPSGKTPLTAAGVGAIQDISQFIGGFDADESEVSIAVNPTNSQNIVAFSNAFSGEGTVGILGGMMISYTKDGGATWHPHYIATGSDNFNAACCDPSMAFDRFGNLWFSYVDFLPDVDSTVVLLSTDGGVSYSVAHDFLDATNNAIDQPKLAVGDNSVWVIWHDVATTNEPDGKMQTSTAFVSGLGTWSGFFGFNDIPPTPNGSFQNFGKIAVGPSGQVLLTFQDPTTGEGPDTIWSSLDIAGTTGAFATPTVVTTTNVGSFATPSNQPDRMVDAESDVAYDRSNGSHRGRVYVVYNDRPSTISNSFDIYTRFSDNNGATWSNRVRVTDDSTGQPKILPRIKVDQTSGNIAVSWLDSRNDPSGVGAEAFIAFSADGGNTFSKNIQVAPALSNVTLADNANDFGDFTGLDFNNGVAWPAWPDNSTALASINVDAPNSFDIATAPVNFAQAFSGSNLPEDIYEPDETSDTAHNFGTLNGAQAITGLTVTIHSNGLPDYDWAKWTMAHSGTFTATQTTDSGGPLELHIFKLVGGTLVDVGDSTGSGSVKTLMASVNANDTMYVESKGQNTSPGVFTTGAYHLNVSV